MHPYLKWPFIGTVIIELLNQLEDKNYVYHLVTLTLNNFARVGSAWGCTTFIPHSQLSHDPVKKDTVPEGRHSVFQSIIVWLQALVGVHTEGTYMELCKLHNKGFLYLYSTS